MRVGLWIRNVRQQCHHKILRNQFCNFVCRELEILGKKRSPSERWIENIFLKYSEEHERLIEHTIKMIYSSRKLAVGNNKSKKIHMILAIRINISIMLNHFLGRLIDHNSTELHSLTEAYSSAKISHNNNLLNSLNNFYDQQNQ